jgi:hypothetical protein
MMGHGVLYNYVDRIHTVLLDGEILITNECPCTIFYRSTRNVGIPD